MIDDAASRTHRDLNLLVADELRGLGFENAEEIGCGGFGVVYRCWQVGLNRTVAVKVLTGDLDEESRARFVWEQQAMGRLTGHPNLVTVLAAGVTSGGRPYVAMPYYPVDSLDARIRQRGPLPVDDVLKVGAGIARALESAHQLGIVHGDVQPGNILFPEYGEPALTDFGIARIPGGFETAADTLMASPVFTALEVLEGGAPTPAADVYGLGATLYCALTGHAAAEPRSSEQVVAEFAHISQGQAPDLRDRGFPAEVCAVVEAAMHRDPEQRPSAAELGATIRQLQQSNGYQGGGMAPHSDPASAFDHVPQNHPPASSRTTGHNRNLLPELTSFINRRAELTALKHVLTVSRLVTLAGMGGVGKTRLALRAASAARRDFADGVWAIDLADVRDPSLVAPIVAAALGVRVDSAQPVHDTLVEFLRSREALLVVDNCEQVAEPMARLAERLLSACPGLRMLVTSREPLDIGGEVVQRLPPLSVPAAGREPTLRQLRKYDAVTLFADRADAVVPGFELTEENKAAVAGICTRLDGLPLAIELAAARMRTMSPDQILQRLTDRFALLTRGHRTAPTRQQALRWCIDWSYELCTPAEQRLWARLSVFAGGFELEAVEAVCGAEAEAAELLDVLSSLVDKSVVIREEPEGAVRFRMLDTVRDYGQDKLREAGADEELRRRHRDWYRRLVLDAEDDWISDRQCDWMARLDREQGNIRAALEFCMSDPTEQSAEAGLRISAASLTFWSFRGLFGEGRRWLDRALAHPYTRSTTDQVRALHASIFMATRQWDLQTAAGLLEQGRVLAERDPTPLNQALIAYAEGDLALYRDEPPRAVSCINRAIEVLSSEPRGCLHVAALLLLGVAYAQQGDAGRADECHQRILSITEECGESLFRSTALGMTAIAACRQGESSRAQDLLRESLRLNRRVRSLLVAALDLEVLAWVAAGTDDQRAAVLMGAAANMMRTAPGVAIYFPQMVEAHLDCERVARGALGAARFDAAWRRGRAMRVNAAIAYALNEEQPADTPRPGATTLTKRERQVADLVAEGLTNKQIAAQLVIAPRTVDAHVEHILAKLGFNSRAQIAAWIVDAAQPGR
ncbi:protein kinase [Nocardia sp. SYP-A9097]|uniref:protein kinase domain-containing protein n=1 Tax=Nocardia sp. SYP-A9097 TaxID=2663237 RepID=UPI00129BDA20|nr:protein kinase [Nocardia sp. SYP-A9097]MRH87782.1 protein kinase [Nocardia sp. SYP-A9097]